MLFSTLEQVPGRQIDQVLGLATGSVVTSKHFGKDFMASMKTIVGGEIKGYTEMLEENAAALGADAVLGIRLTSSSVMQSAAEVTAYGTAVTLR